MLEQVNKYSPVVCRPKGWVKAKLAKLLERAAKARTLADCRSSCHALQIGQKECGSSSKLAHSTTSQV